MLEILQKLSNKFNLSLFEKHKLLKVLSLNSFSVATSFVLGLFSIKIVSVFLGPSGMALIGNFRNFTNLIKSISVIGLNEGFIKLLKENNDTIKRNKIISSLLMFFFSITFISALFVILYSKSLSFYLFQSFDYFYYIICFGLLLPFFTMQTFVVSFLNSENEFKKIIKIQIYGAILIFLTTVYLIFEKKLTGAIISLAISDCILFIVALYFIKKNKQLFHFIFIKKIDFNPIKTINKFILMALLSAIIVPLTTITIRNLIIIDYSAAIAGKWEAINRISGFYMMFFSSGLSMYYLPKLSQLRTENEFKNEIIYYFKAFIPIVFIVLLSVFFLKDLIITIALTDEFSSIKGIIIWQLIGDFFKVMSLAFGFQLVIKTKLFKYIIVEIFFNLTYLIITYFLITEQSITGVVKAYCISSILTFVLILFMFRNIFLKKNNI